MTTKQNYQVPEMPETTLTVLVDSVPGEAAVAAALPVTNRPAHIQVLDQCGHDAVNAASLLVFSAASRLDSVAECVSVANKAHRLTALLVHKDVEDNWLSYALHQSGLRMLRNMIVHSDVELPTRILSAWAIGGEHDFIADATVIKDRLFVRSCAFEEFSLDFDVFPALRAIPESGRSHFTLQDQGLLLYWEAYDVHLDLDDIRFAANPRARQKAKAAQIGDHREIGTALRILREKAGLKQFEIEGISERQVRRVESGDPLTISALDSFARALRIESDDLLELLGDTISLGGSEDFKELGYADDWSQVTTKVGEHVRDQISAYRSSAAGSFTDQADKVSRNLRLAAGSSESEKEYRWELGIAGGGEICGHLESSFRTDELVFRIDGVHGASIESGHVRIIARSKRFADPMISNPFVPTRGDEVTIVRGKGVLPGDIVCLELAVE